MKLFTVGGISTILLICGAACSSAQCSDEMKTDTVASSSCLESRVTLFDSTADDRKRMGYLLLDKQGLPSIYPAPRRNPISGLNNDLSGLSKAELSQIWPLHALNEEVYRADLVGWHAGWTLFSVDLKFEKNKCIAFRMLIDGQSKSDWTDCTKMPYDLNKTALTLPVEIGCIEGPRTITHCNNSTP